MAKKRDDRPADEVTHPIPAHLRAWHSTAADLGSFASGRAAAWHHLHVQMQKLGFTESQSLELLKTFILGSESGGVRGTN